jgi:hypothetical protein
MNLLRKKLKNLVHGLKMSRKIFLFRINQHAWTFEPDGFNCYLEKSFFISELTLNLRGFPWLSLYFLNL